MASSIDTLSPTIPVLGIIPFLNGSYCNGVCGALWAQSGKV